MSKRSSVHHLHDIICQYHSGSIKSADILESFPGLNPKEICNFVKWTQLNKNVEFDTIGDVISQFKIDMRSRPFYHLQISSGDAESMVSESKETAWESKEAISESKETISESRGSHMVFFSFSVRTRKTSQYNTLHFGLMNDDFYAYMKPFDVRNKSVYSLSEWQHLYSRISRHELTSQVIYCRIKCNMVKDNLVKKVANAFRWRDQRWDNKLVFLRILMSCTYDNHQENTNHPNSFKEHRMIIPIDVLRIVHTIKNDNQEFLHSALMPYMVLNLEYHHYEITILR